MKLLSSLVLLLPLFSASVLAQQKPYLNIDTVAREAEYKADVTPSPLVSKNVWTNSIPQSCVDRARQLDGNGVAHCQLQNIRVFQATFADVPGEPWVICYCTQAAYSEARMIEEVGRLPPGIRQFVRAFIGFPGPEQGGGTVTAGRDVVLYGYGPLLYLHEAGHLLDDAPGKPKFSTTPLFLNALDAASCWLSEYSRSRAALGYWWEPWTVALTWRRYQRHVGTNLGVDYSCAANVLQVVASQTDALITAGFQAVNKPQFAPGDIVQRSSITPW